jgi:hypothetical protein
MVWRPLSGAQALPPPLPKIGGLDVVVVDAVVHSGANGAVALCLVPCHFDLLVMSENG